LVRTRDVGPERREFSDQTLAIAVADLIEDEWPEQLLTHRPELFRG
jgi:hypothetical protein